MASPVVQASGTGTDNSTPLTVTLPGTPADNDVYLIFLANSSGGSWSLSSGTGWTELYDANGNACYYKKVSASESDPSFAWTGGGRAVWLAYRITGAEDPATQAPESLSLPMRKSKSFTSGVPARFAKSIMMPLIPRL